MHVSLNAKHASASLQPLPVLKRRERCQCRYYVLVLAVIVPFFAVANAYGTGLTDFDMSSVYGTVSSQCPSPVAELY